MSKNNLNNKNRDWNSGIKTSNLTFCCTFSYEKLEFPTDKNIIPKNRIPKPWVADNRKQKIIFIL